MSLRELFFQKKPRRARNPLYAIIDSSNETLIALSIYPAPLLFVNESLMDSIFLHDIEPSEETIAIWRSNLATYPEWTWHFKKRSFVRTHPDLITPDMRARAVLVVKKVDAIRKAIYAINTLRLKVDTGLWLQETIYAEKEREARALKDAGFTEASIEAGPYVVQYAEVSGMPVEHAANEILLQAQLDREYLLKTEKVRLEVFKKLKFAHTPDEVDRVYREFLKQGL